MATATNPATAADPDSIVGRYEALLSNHAGVDDKGTAVPDSATSDSQWGASARIAGPDTHGYTIREQVGGNRGEIMAHYWRDGQVEGSFYGPEDALEAVGIWWLPAAESEVAGGVLGIVGSFGVKAQTASN